MGDEIKTILPLQWREHAVEHRAIEKRLSEIEYGQKRIDERLDRGAETIHSHRERLTAIEDALRPTWWRVLSTVGPVLLVAGTFLWALARYPDREDYVKMHDQAIEGRQAMEKLLDKRIDELEISNRDMKKDIEQLQKDLNHLTEPPKRRRAP